MCSVVELIYALFTDYLSLISRRWGYPRVAFQYPLPLAGFGPIPWDRTFMADLTMVPKLLAVSIGTSRKHSKLQDGAFGET